jgi:LmbE family N-acetylglucosaminyl deacetylase
MVKGPVPLQLNSTRRILIVAPHPDDETLGCGGLIALALRKAIDVSVVFATDGTGSHRHSPSVSARRLGAIRRREARHALAVLGVRPTAIRRLGLEDRFVAPTAPARAAAEIRARRLLQTFRPDCLVMPSRSDRHGDHRALANVWGQAAAECAIHRVLEYLIWPSGRRAAGTALVLDATEVVAAKRQAIQAHRSQRGLVITDDASGFTLPRFLMARARHPTETYYEITG